MSRDLILSQDGHGNPTADVPSFTTHDSWPTLTYLDGADILSIYLPENDYRSGGPARRTSVRLRDLKRAIAYLERDSVAAPLRNVDLMVEAAARFIAGKTMGDGYNGARLPREQWEPFADDARELVRLVCACQSPSGAGAGR